MYNPIEMKLGKILIYLLVLSTSALNHPLANKTEANQSKLIDYNEPEEEVSTISQMEKIELLKTWLNTSKTLPPRKSNRWKIFRIPGLLLP